ncbi:MAG: phosphoribosyltransferase [Candidatus Hodarchaeaceae archaeon]|nr:phosphoribosyltransferase [Candidatus Hodarchaeaceae archaeon]
MEPVPMGWHEVEKAVAALANALRRGYDPDVIVGVARGGLIPAVRLSHLLGDKMLRIIHVKYYKGVNLRREEPELLADVGKLEGKVLVVDDVADTGTTLEFVVRHLKERGAKEVRVATVAWKPHSRIKPDFYVFETDKWIVFPWEEMEVRRGQ